MLKVTDNNSIEQMNTLQKAIYECMPDDLPNVQALALSIKIAEKIWDAPVDKIQKILNGYVQHCGHCEVIYFIDAKDIPDVAREISEFKSESDL